MASTAYHLSLSMPSIHPANSSAVSVSTHAATNALTTFAFSGPRLTYSNRRKHFVTIQICSFRHNRTQEAR